MRMAIITIIKIITKTAIIAFIIITNYNKQTKLY